jgi:hypothetical protein
MSTFQLRSPSLHRLGASNLVTFTRRKRIERHVLRLEGATSNPSCRRMRHKAPTVSDLPASEAVPKTINAFADIVLALCLGSICFHFPHIDIFQLPFFQTLRASIMSEAFICVSCS